MTRFLHSRYGVVLAALLAAACAWAYASLGCPPELPADGALVPGWSFDGVLAGPWALAAGWAANVAIAALMCYINKAFNLLRGMTMLQGALFLVMEVATPVLLLSFSPGLLLCLVLAVCMLVMYLSYGNPNAQRGVFLVFLLLSAGAATDYSFLAFMPVFWLGCAQMRIFSLRTVLASLMGLVTPWIIFFGFGLLEPSSLAMPRVYDGFSVDSLGDAALLGSSAFTSLAALFAWAQNVIKLLAYNAQSRAMLSLANVAMFMAIAVGATNMSHMETLLPAINFFASLQLAHLFVSTCKGPRSWWGIISFIIIYLAIYAWRLAICIL